MADNIRPFRRREPEQTTAEEKELKKKVFRHRIRAKAAAAALLLAAAVIIACFYIDYQRKSYTTYTIVEWNELSGMENSESVSFGDCLLRYNKDGAACINYDNEQIWNQPYEMQAPIIDINTGAAAIADKSGNKIYIFGKDGLKGEIETLLPIQKISVSNLYTVAVLLKDGDVSRVSYYDSSGSVISEMKIGMDNMGYPLAMDISPDGKLFMLSFLSVAEGGMNSVISYYNFGNVGQEYNDRLVKAKTYEDTVFPVVEFLDDRTSVAYGDNQTEIFEGSQIPEEKAVIPFEQEIRSIFTDGNSLGYILDNEGGSSPYRAVVYDLEGKEKFSRDVDLAYSRAKIDREKVILFNEKECVIYSINGVKKFEGEFESTIKDIISTNKQSRYIIITPTELDRIKLE